MRMRWAIDTPSVPCRHPWRSVTPGAANVHQHPARPERASAHASHFGDSPMSDLPSTVPPPPAPDAVPAKESVPLYTEEFANHPQRVYARLREFGPVAPIELTPGGVRAMLVTDFQAAMDVLHDTERFSKDPRGWETTLDPDDPLFPL